MSPNRLSQEQKAIQRQIATQQTIRLMQLVELPTTSLEQEIQKEVEENPALEAFHDEDDFMQSPENDDFLSSEYDKNGDPVELSGDTLSGDDIYKEDYSSDDDSADYPSEKEIEDRIDRLNAPETAFSGDRNNVYYHSLHEQWQIQLDEMDMTERQSQIAHYLAGNLDDSGYFTGDLQSVVNELLYMNNLYTDVHEVEEVLVNFVQELDPVGTGARNLQECLLLQLKRNEPDDATCMATRIVEHCFDFFLKKHYDKIKLSLNIDDTQLKAALAVIRKLDPRPADMGTPLERSAEMITPDFLITAQNGQLSLMLNNQYVPKVRINKEFRNEYRFLTKAASEKKRAEAEKFMQEYVDKGNQFINTLSLREMILYNTMYAIMMHQKQYFLTGDDSTIKPMILKTIAEEVKLDVSTISRVSNSKFVQSDFGVIPLKHLFSEAVNNDDVSSKEIKQILSDLVSEEEKKNPLSDDLLCKMLSDKGYKIARRTVAKYREQLGIPVARMRKEV